MQRRLPEVNNLLGSSTDTDVKEAMQALVFAHSFELDGARPSKILTLVFSKEANIKAAAVQAAQSVWLRLSPSGRGGSNANLAQCVATARSMLELVADASIAEATSLEEVMAEWQRQKALPTSLINIFWDVVQGRKPELGGASHRHGSLALLNMAAVGDAQLLRCRMDLLIQQLSAARSDLDSRHACVALRGARPRARGPEGGALGDSLDRARARRRAFERAGLGLVCRGGAGDRDRVQAERRARGGDDERARPHGLRHRQRRRWRRRLGRARASSSRSGTPPSRRSCTSRSARRCSRRGGKRSPTRRSGDGRRRRAARAAARRRARRGGGAPAARRAGRGGRRRRGTGRGGFRLALLAGRHPARAGRAAGQLGAARHRRVHQRRGPLLVRPAQLRGAHPMQAHVRERLLLRGAAAAPLHGDGRARGRNSRQHRRCAG